MTIRGELVRCAGSAVAEYGRGYGLMRYGLRCALRVGCALRWKESSKKKYSMRPASLDFISRSVESYFR